MNAYNIVPIKIMSLYIGCGISGRATFSPPIGKIVGTLNEWVYYTTESDNNESEGKKMKNYQATEPINVSILVKPLGTISGDHLFTLSKKLAETVEETKRIFSGHWSPLERISPKKQDQWLNRRDVIEFLIENGYATPYKNYSVGELVHYGIYKFID